MANKKLKYLFKVQYADDTVYKQTPNDISKVDETKSEYFDVMEEVRNGKVIHFFTLVGDGNEIMVDLGTGLFYVNGLRILAEGDKLPTLPDEFKLIFYRQWDQEIVVNYKKNKEGIFKFLSNTPKPDPHCEYFIGWQCTIAGKNYQQKIAVS